MGTLAEGIKEIFATAKTTGSNVMLCGNDGTPDGHMTMDNLASVLGIQTVSLQRGTDLDSLRTPNKYTCSDGSTSGTILNKPSNVLYGFLLEVKPCPNAPSTVVQILWADGGRMFSRTYDNGWSNWLTYSYDIPDFYKSYSDLASLANALGVGLFIKRGSITSQDYDFRNNAQIGIYHVPGSIGVNWKGLSTFSDICVLFNNMTSGEPQIYDTIIAISYDFGEKKLKYYNAFNDTFELI